MKKRYFSILFVILCGTAFYADALFRTDLSVLKSEVFRLNSPPVHAGIPFFSMAGKSSRNSSAPVLGFASFEALPVYETLSKTGENNLSRLQDSIGNIEENHRQALKIFSISIAFLLMFAIYALYYNANLRKKSEQLLSLLDEENKRKRGQANVQALFQDKKPGEIEEQVRDEVEKEKKKKYEGSSLTEEEADLYLNRLLRYMKEEKPYLDCELTIRSLAKRLSVPQKELSRIINEKLNKNFWSFINDYRIMEAKRLLINSAKRDVSILEIAFDSGFNSKSSFNEVFKKYLNTTPSRFQKLHAV